MKLFLPCAFVGQASCIIFSTHDQPWSLPRMMLVLVAALMAVVRKQRTFVIPVLHKAALAMTAVTVMSEVPVLPISFGDAAKELSTESYPFLKEIDWTSSKAFGMGASMDPELLIAEVEAHSETIGSGCMVAPVPEGKTMDVYESLFNLVNTDIPNDLMSTVDEADVKQAYEAFLITDAAKANSIIPAADMSSVLGGKIDEAAARLTADVYPFMKNIDWTSKLYLKETGAATAKNALAAVNKALVMCDEMDSRALQDTSRPWKALHQCSPSRPTMSATPLPRSLLEACSTSSTL